MAFVGTGGASAIASAQIVDATIINADINPAADIEQHKIEPSQGDNTDLINFEITQGVTHSLTTVAGQRVLVIATGRVDNVDNATATINLQYGGVTQESMTVASAGAGADQRHAFALQCVLAPGAATANIGVTADKTLADVAISVIKVMADA